MFQSVSARHCRLARLSGHHWSDFPQPYITGPFLLEEQQKHLRRLRTRSHMRSELIQAADCRYTTPLHFSFLFFFFPNANLCPTLPLAFPTFSAFRFAAHLSGTSVYFGSSVPAKNRLQCVEHITGRGPSETGCVLACT